MQRERGNIVMKESDWREISRLQLQDVTLTSEFIFNQICLPLLVARVITKQTDVISKVAVSFISTEIKFMLMKK